MVAIPVLLEIRMLIPGNNIAICFHLVSVSVSKFSASVEPILGMVKFNLKNVLMNLVLIEFQLCIGLKIRNFEVGFGNYEYKFLNRLYPSI